MLILQERLNNNKCSKNLLELQVLSSKWMISQRIGTLMISHRNRQSFRMLISRFKKEKSYLSSVKSAAGNPHCFSRLWRRFLVIQVHVSMPLLNSHTLNRSRTFSQVQSAITFSLETRTRKRFTIPLLKLAVYSMISRNSKTEIARLSARKALLSAVDRKHEWA